MNKEEMEQAIKKATGEYVEVINGADGVSIVLDGTFTLEQLESVVKIIKDSIGE